MRSFVFRHSTSLVHMALRSPVGTLEVALVGYNVCVAELSTLLTSADFRGTVTLVVLAARARVMAAIVGFVARMICNSLVSIESSRHVFGIFGRTAVRSDQSFTRLQSSSNHLVGAKECHSREQGGHEMHLEDDLCLW